MKKVMRYFIFWARLSLFHLKKDLVYRASFWSGILSAFIHAFLRVAIIIFLTDKVISVAGWSRQEMVLFAGTYQIIISLSFLFIYRGLMWLFRNIDSGELDMVLFKPLDSQFLATVRTGGIANLIASFFGFYLLFYSFDKIGGVSLKEFIAFLLFLLMSLVLIYNLFLMFSLIGFFANKASNILDLTFRSLDFSQFPSDAYQKLGTSVFFLILPISFLTTVPSKILLGRLQVEDLALFFLLVIFSTLIARFLWKFALRNYQSASS